MSPPEMDDLLFSPFQQALGKQTWARIQQQLRNYDYYDGKQHVDPETGALVPAKDLPRPFGMDYDPTRYTTNYFKSFIKRKARWQMGGQHGISVPPTQIDDVAEAAKPEYEPSTAQKSENERAEKYERLLYDLWRENKMRERLLQAARDRLIAGRVACKIAFNPRNGKMRWIFESDDKVVPVFSEDDFEDLLAVHFIKTKMVDEEPLIQKQSYTMEDDGFCYLEEKIYRQDLSVYKTVTKKESLQLDFIPVVLFPVTDLTGEHGDVSEIEDMKSQTDVLNAMNEDAIDSLKFEMFSMTALINAAEGTSDGIKVAPGSILELRGTFDGAAPQVEKIEGGFRWKEAFKDQYSRVKGALHEITSLPQIVPQELNFGGLNADALHVLFQDIIQETEEHWLVWGPRLSELHEKTIRYMQARSARPNFAYDRNVVKSIGTNYANEMRFVLPLPDNRQELVNLLTLEMDAELESQAGAMNRLGVENVSAKKQEIANERASRRERIDPYAGLEGEEPSSELT